MALKKQNGSEVYPDLVALTTYIYTVLFCPHLAFVEIMRERKIPFPHEAKRFFGFFPTVFFAIFCSLTGERTHCLPVGILRK